MHTPENIDQYISVFPDEIQAILQHLRTVIKKASPASEEKISYGIPTFYLHGNLVHFAAYKRHIGFYPASSAIREFKDEFTRYKWSKGAVQFPFDKPLPLNLIKRIVKFRAAENLEKIERNNASKNIYIKYHNNGTIWAKGKLSNGKPNGYWEWFRKDGVIMRSGYFTKGKQTGKWTTYDQRGKVVKVTHFK